MYLRSLIAGVGLVATANALLVPLDFPISDADDSVTTLPVPTEIDVDVAVSKVPVSTTLNLKCPGCIVSRHKHRKEIPSHLQLEFRVESNDGADRLTLNGYELYPNPDLLRETLTAPVLPDMMFRHLGDKPGAIDRFREKHTQRLGFAMETGAVATDEEEDLQLITVDVQIIEVGDVFIERIPDVQVKLVKTPSGKLAIGTVEPIESKGAGSLDGKEECSTMICRWKAAFFEKLTRLFYSKPCNGDQPPPPSPHHHHDGEGRHGHGLGHHPHGPPHHHMGHRHGWAHGLRVFLTHILLPIMIGIVAGVSASL